MAINPKIKQKAEDIRKKIFGSEVRESLASGIEAISEDVEATIGRQDYVEEQFQDVLDETTRKDVISAPELIAARNGEANLKTRLDKEKQDLTAQLQQIENEGVLVGDQTKTKFGYFSINKERQTIDYHGFEDWGLLNATDLDRGYCSFDAKPILTSANRQSHLVGYQSRAIYSGSGGLKDYMNAYDTDMKHNGTGEINRVRQIFIKDIGGNGPVKDNFGLYISPITRGSNINWGIYSENDRNMLMGVHTLAIKAITKDLAITYGSDLAGKNITFGYQAGATNTGEFNFYNGVTTLLATLNNAWLKLSRQLIVGSFTYAQLPPSEKGGIAYCTNGRKTGEGTGAGTGVLVYYDGVWKSMENHQLVTI